jgi:paraquat-inducible protein B
LSVSAGSLESMLAGGIQFDTPTEVLEASPAPPNTQFPLYDDEHSARSQPVGPRLYYQVHFPGSIAGVGVGASVQLLGIEVGRVSDVRIEYDRASHILQTPVILEIRPNTISGLVASNQMDMTVYVNGALTYLVARGLRARLSSSNLITGQRQVNLEFVNDASTYIVS